MVLPAALPLAGAALRFLASRGLAKTAFATGSRTLGRGAQKVGNWGRGAHTVPYTTPTATRGASRFIFPTVATGAVGAGVWGASQLLNSPEDVAAAQAGVLTPEGFPYPAGSEEGAGYPTMAASTMSPGYIDFNMAAPQNPSGMLSAAAKRAYQPTINYAKSVIPYYENREKASKREIKDLRNIAEESWIDTAGRIRTGTAESTAQQEAYNAERSQRLEEGVAGRTEGMDKFLQSIGAKEVKNADQAIKEEGTAATGLAAAEGSIFSGLVQEQGMTSADYADTLAGLQDTAAAADIALLRQNMSELIFRQQGRIAEAQQAQAVAMMQAALQGQQMYQDAYNQYTGMAFDAASTNARLAQEAAQFNASAQNAASEFNASAAMAAMGGGDAGAGEVDFGTGLVGGMNATQNYLMARDFSPRQITEQLNAYNTARGQAVKNIMTQGGELNEQSILWHMENWLQQQGFQYDPAALQVYVNQGV